MHQRIQKWLLPATAGFVLTLTAVRAVAQSITFDEAFSYLHFARSLAGVLWFNSNNHLLNSWLMWMFTGLFGPSNLTIRGPALLGAVIFTAACYLYCTRATSHLWTRWLIFVCLTCNPFILDYMVAARGYSLANAFLTAAVVCVLVYRPSAKRCAFASVALGLAVSANLSFAFVGTVVYIALLIWALSGPTESVWRVAARCTLPGLSALTVICGYSVLRWWGADWQGELWWGAHSLSEMWRSLVDSSFYQVNPSFLYAAQVRWVQPWLLPTLGILCLAQAVLIRPRVGTVAGILGGSVGLSWIAYRFGNLPLPVGRTGIYLVTLLTLLVAQIAVAPAIELPANWMRKGIIATLTCFALYFFLCLRTTHFREYREDADADVRYAILAALCRVQDDADVQAAGVFVTTLNYYREVAGASHLAEFKIGSPEISPGHRVYVLHMDFWDQFIRDQNLRLIYSNELTRAAIAVDPRFERGWSDK